MCLFCQIESMTQYFCSNCLQRNFFKLFFFFRIQIHFKNPADKPIDVVHSLKLDKTYTGLQTLGAETVVDVWLHQQNNSEKKSENLFPEKSSHVIKCENVTTAAASSPCKSLVQNSKVKSEPLESADVKIRTKQEKERDVQTTFIRCKDKEGGSFFLPVTVLPNNCQKRVDWNRTCVNQPLKPQRIHPDQVRLSVEHVPPSQQQQQQPKKQKNNFANGNGIHHPLEGSQCSNR